MCYLSDQFSSIYSGGFKILSVKAADGQLIGCRSEVEEAQAVGALEYALQQVFLSVPKGKTGWSNLSKLANPLSEMIQGLPVFETIDAKPYKLLFSICPDCNGAILWAVRNFPTFKA